MIKNVWLRIVIYTILVSMIVFTASTIIKARNFYGITLDDLARVGDTATEQVYDLKQTVVNISDGYGSGTGVVVYADKLFIYVLTNYHVIDDFIYDKGYVKFITNNIDYCIKRPILIASEESSDLAIICVIRATEKFKIAEVAEESPESGDEILTIGFPIGITHFCSRGTYTKSHSKYFFTSDLAVAPGASGSPVFNSDGKLIGLQMAMHTIPLPKGRYWKSFSSKEHRTSLVRSSIGINLKTIKRLLEKIS